MKAEEKPVYESPKVSSLDYNESAVGSVELVACEPGSSATGHCANNGNSAYEECGDGSIVVNQPD